MTDKELIKWREETLKMAQPIMERLDGVCPYYKVVVSSAGATLSLDEAHVPNPKYSPLGSTNEDNADNE